MEEIVKKSLIATYRKLREEKHTQPLDIIGLFVNYYYKITEMRQSRKMRSDEFLSTAWFLCNKQKGIWVIRARPNTQPWCEGAKPVVKSINQYSFSDLYSFYLQSAFTDPINEQYYTIPLIQF